MSAPWSLIQLLLKTTGAASSDGMAVLAATRRELVERFQGVTAYVRSPAKGLWMGPDGHTEADDVVMAVGQEKKDDPADAARVGFDAMMRGDGDVVSGWKNNRQSAIANVAAAGLLAEQHRRLVEPGSAGKLNE